MSYRRLRRIAGAGAAALSAVCSHAAQPDTVEEITVTARKYVERLQDVPLTITAFTVEEMQAAGFESIRDVVDHTPGVFISSTTGRNQDRLAIRGQTSVSTAGGPNAGIFIDGIYVSGSAQTLELDNVERVELLKGPQSALFGRSTLSGAVNYVTRRPSNQFYGVGKASVAEHGEYVISGLVSGPINAKWSYLVSARQFERDGEFVNQVSGARDIGGQSSTGGSLGLRWQPTDAFDAYLRVMYQEDDDQPIAIYTQGPEFNNCLLDTPRQYYCGRVRPDPSSIRLVTRSPIYRDGEAGTNREALRTALQLDWDLGPVTLASVTSYTDEQTREGFDATYRAAPNVPAMILPSGPPIDITRSFEDISQELRVQSNRDTGLRYLGGVYFFDSDRREIATYIPSGPNRDRGVLNARNFAVFGRLEYELLDRLTVGAELRWQKDRLSLEDPDSNIDLRSEFTNTLPRATLDYKITDDVMVYGLFAKGNKPGSFNLVSGLAPELIPIDEEEAETYELGVKASLFDRRVYLAASAYYVDWLNQEQATSCGPPQCTQQVFYTANLGQSVVRGLELDLSAVVIPNWWSLRLTHAITDTEIKYAQLVGRPNDSALIEAAAFGFPAIRDQLGRIVQVNVRGTDVPATPEHTFSASTTVGNALWSTGYEWFVRADYLRIGSQFDQIFNAAYTGTRENLHLRLGLKNERLEVAVFGRNLTDDDTPLAIIRSISFSGPSLAAASVRAFPAILQSSRTFGLTMRYQFGN